MPANAALLRENENHFLKGHPVKQLPVHNQCLTRPNNSPFTDLCYSLTSLYFPSCRQVRGIFHSSTTMPNKPLLSCVNRRTLSLFCTLLLALTSLSQTLLANELIALRGRRLIPTKWADGDSFLVVSPDRGEFTLRLYGADCIEWHVTDASDERRLRTQRRYFGISKAGADARASINLAKSYGESADKETKTALAKPFTVYTSFADARGDGKHKRIYGFIVTSDGEDLASRLVSKGLARAFGVYRRTWDDRTHREYQEHLKDLEIIAIKKNAGVWKSTDWNALPQERRAQREEERLIELAIDGKAPLDGVKLNPNTAARDDLMRLPGIGEELAHRIITARPYKNPQDLLKVSGIGLTTLKKIQPHIKFH